MQAKNCINCKKKYFKKLTSSKTEWEKSKYCSVSCFHAYKRKMIKCKVCGKSFTVKKALINVLKTCSQKCKLKWRSKLSKDLVEKHGSPMDRGNARINSSNTYKKKYANGEMEHMKEVWKKRDWKKENNPRWVPVGTIKEAYRGYKKIKVAENCWKLHHHYIMEKEIGREIKEYEVVHHINGKKGDNRIENLQLLTDTEHRSLHMTERHNNN